MVENLVEPTPNIAYWFFRSKRAPKRVKKDIYWLTYNLPISKIGLGDIDSVELHLLVEPEIIIDPSLRVVHEELLDVFPAKQYPGFTYALEMKSLDAPLLELSDYLRIMGDTLSKVRRDLPAQQLPFRPIFPRQLRYHRFQNGLVEHLG